MSNETQAVEKQVENEARPGGGCSFLVVEDGYGKLEILNGTNPLFLWPFSSIFNRG